MGKVKKIKKEELEIIVKTNKEISEVLIQVGGMEAQKHSALHKIAELNQVIEEEKKKLEEAYGQVSVNLETGEYEEIKTKE
tara:strand:+ start:449 stop:691 length:243 start_codon:yes stop_codon:yes gene_type:complete